MASVIIGSAIDSTTDSKVLQRQNFSKEPNGLETIIEAYAIKTLNRDTIVPVKGVLHSAFSSSTKKYTRMVVESVATEEQDGGITQILVTFVGLTSSTGLPPTIVRIIPTAGAGIFGPPLTIEAEFLTDSSETQFINGSISPNVVVALPSTLVGNTSINKMPAFINGTKMPEDPRPPFIKRGKNSFYQYFGYTTQTFGCERRGLFLVARTTYLETDVSVAAV